MNINNSLKSLLALTLVCGLVSCRTPSNSSSATESNESISVHEHTFAEEWSKDETHHWYEANCGHADQKVKTEHVFGNPVESTDNLVKTTTWTCGDCGYEKVETIASLLINYKLPDGTLIDSHVQDIKPGETYSVVSPKVRFMAPSIATVEGTMDANGEVIDVTYDYSVEAMETEVSPGRDMGKLYVDEKKGLSLSYVMKGSSGDWEQVFQGNTFAIYNGCIRVRDANPAKVYAGDWYDGSNAVNGSAWNELLTSSSEEILVTWSFNANGSITVYKNGKMVFLFSASTPANGKWSASGQNYNLMVSNVTEHLFAEVAEKGLTLGAFVDNGSTPVTWTMRDLSVGYAMDVKEASAYASQYKSIKGIYVDDTGLEVANPCVLVSKIGSEYSIPATQIDGYTSLTETVAGTVTADTSVVTLNYTRNGEEKISEAKVSDQIVAGWGWTDENRWAIATETLQNGQTVTIDYRLESTSYTNSDAAKTNIVIAYDVANHGNRSANRFDWWGWEDGDFCSDRTNGNMWCGSMAEYHEVQKDCNVRLNATFKDGTLTLTYIIVANSGVHAGKVYHMTTYAHGITAETIGIALSPEHAKVTLTSVKY